MKRLLLILIFLSCASSNDNWLDIEKLWIENPNIADADSAIVFGLSRFDTTLVPDWENYQESEIITMTYMKVDSVITVYRVNINRDKFYKYRQLDQYTTDFFESNVNVGTKELIVDFDSLGDSFISIDTLIFRPVKKEQ